ncbi:(2Fe-2S) ferredoxin domain-containing protein [Roseospirillum parvum]|uniref:(2Fe-2S) ferredoxin n=1 Tax=Roseospirillum parvum TaxID=83401 RepID=A0A1G8DSQ4_9PROT|nr:(2Fe-2S) ferredoxin domain-containing protein [Roseospirillum parvum]SDH60615.1 (2Fe-2S) ferredoxin [Roseospirillum parvum]
MSRHPDDPPLYYDLHIFCCTNVRPEGHSRPSCGAAGSAALRDHMKARVKELGLTGVRVNSSACLDRCESGPVLVVYPEGIWYRCTSPAEMDAIIEQHLVAKGRARSLMLDQGDPGTE